MSQRFYAWKIATFAFCWVLTLAMIVFGWFDGDVWITPPILYLQAGVFPLLIYMNVDRYRSARDVNSSSHTSKEPK